MDTNGVAENEWRKVSYCMEEVGRIRSQYLRVLQLIKRVGADQVQHVPGISIEVDIEAETAVIKSFAGESRIRLGWDASKESLVGVAIASSVKHAGDAPTELLKVYIPDGADSAYLLLENGERVSMGVRPSDFAFVVLMTVVRKQVGISA